MVISSPVKSPVLTTETPSKASIKLIERSAAPNPNHQPLFCSVACGTSIIEGSILYPHGRLRTLDHAAREEEARSAKYSTSRRRPRAGAMNSLVNARVANSSTSPRWGCSGLNRVANARTIKRGR